ncbi:MAG: hypothetical protein AABZ12_13935 [Planctomycetota bacterium]
MIVSVLFLLLVLGVAFRQATLGLFSAIIMAVLTVCCAAAALGSFEWVAVNFLAVYWKRDFAYSIALAGTFGVPLVILRLVLDKVITRACPTPGLVDRIGSGILGLVTALTMVGVLALSFQMIPFGRSILGFQRVPSFARDGGKDSPPATVKDGKLVTAGSAVVADVHDLFLSPDRFAAGLVSLLSGGLFGGEKSFYHENPNFVDALSWSSAAPAEVSRYAPPGSINVASAQLVDTLYRVTPGDSKANRPSVFEPIDPSRDRDLLAVAVKLLDKARDETKNHFFTLRQFRLVGRKGDGLLHQEHAVAIQQAEANDPGNHHVAEVKEGAAGRLQVDDVFSPRDASNQVEVVFSVPKGFQPSFVEYKHGARARVTIGMTAAAEESAAIPPPSTSEPPPAAASPPPKRTTRTRTPEPTKTDAAPEAGKSEPAPQTAAADAPPQPAAPTAPEANAPRTRTGRGGNIRGAEAEASKSTFGDQLPLVLRAYRQLPNTTLENGALVDGHLVGDVAEQENGKNAEVRKFAVPGDKRLLQLSARHLEARSGLGRAITQTIATVQNFTVTDDRGNRYLMVGKYAVAKVGGKDVVETLYFSTLQELGAQRTQFDRIKASDLEGEYVLTFLFLVDPGVKIVSFSTGGDATRSDDLSPDNLVAPR